MTGPSTYLATTSDRLTARLEELRRRVESAKAAVNLGQLINERPLTAAGLALAAGAIVGMDRAAGGALRAGVTALLGALLRQGLKGALAGWSADRGDA